MYEYQWNTRDNLNDPVKLLSDAFILRKDVDGDFIDHENLVVPQVNASTAVLCGCPCTTDPCGFLEKNFLYAFNMGTLPQDPKGFRDIMLSHRACTVGKSNRVLLAFRLASGEVVPVEDWIVDHHGGNNDSHVTVAVQNSAGVVAEEINHRKFTIPQLTALNWTLSPVMYVCSGHAQWRDCFPGDARWKDVVATFDEILYLGEFEDYLAIWRVHALLHVEPVGDSVQSIAVDMTQALLLAVDTIRSYLNSEAADANDGYHTVYRALAFLRDVTQRCHPV
jgi:hypothetical protein